MSKSDRRLKKAEMKPKKTYLEPLIDVEDEVDDYYQRQSANFAALNADIRRSTAAVTELYTPMAAELRRRGYSEEADNDDTG